MIKFIEINFIIYRKDYNINGIKRKEKEESGIKRKANIFYNIIK